MDTWHILEQRFHDIGNRDHDVAMTFEKVDDEKYWYSLHGPGQKYEGDGVWRITLVGAPKNGLPVLEKEHYSVEELEETLLRAGRLLNKDEGRNDRDAAGAYRFVKLLLNHYGSRSANNLLYENGDDRFFVNAARVCGMLAGNFANPTATKLKIQKKAAKGSKRSNAARDSQWHDWRHIDGLTDAQIRDRWDAENPCNPVPRENAENGLGVVASAIRREEKRKSQGTS